MQDLTAPGRTLEPVPAEASNRVEWLDGVRALAALFVVLHHVWLMTYGGYPGNNGPWPTDWMVYGHLAVAVFIVVSGYSLTLSPARHGMRLKEGGWTFLRRRFWRIVPPYWAALAVSAFLIMAGLIGSPSGDPVTGRDILVHFLLLQDTIGNTPPNGVFWSIAVEWHIYFLFPLLLLCFRRFGTAVTLPAVAVLVAVQHVAGQFIPAVGAFDRFSPAFFVLFAAGAAAAGLSRRGVLAAHSMVAAAVLGIGFVTAAVLAGPEWVVSEYFWVDLAVGAAAAALFNALAQGRLRWIARGLAARPLAFLGKFAFSLYLVHALALEMLRVHVVHAAGLTGGAAFWTLLGLGLPAAVLAAYGFFALCERPFLTIRSFSQLGGALRSPFRSMAGGRRRTLATNTSAKDPAP
ncbi:acyltransferase family protein [Arthrobacter sp. H-02-3]|uniref:acyltransferase family protein n=1 Tax=Arthrobacter sp. H-02-3 TaxID=2703675 RepID=UPI000DD23CCE|nr:acyltransferase [Arthrobacter sp. H-02-3]PVZ57061.1 acyltransferase [Arthrobacter sp. H-02-3]